MSGVDLGAYDQAALTLSASFESAPEGALSRGELSVLRLTVPECVRNPVPGEGCEGIQSEVVDSASWE